MVEGTTAPKVGLKAWLLLVTLLVMYAFAYLDRSIMALMVDPIKASLGADDFQMGLLQGAAFGAFYALFGLPMGWLVDRYSKRWVLFIGITIWSISASCCGLARSFWQLGVARFGVGAGEATLVPVAYSTISTIFPRERVALGIAIFSLGSAMGGALALGLGGYLIQWATERGGMTLPFVGALEPWQFVFIATGLPGVLVAFLAFTLPERKKTAVVESHEPMWPFVKQNPRYFIFNITGLCCTTALAYGYAAWTPAFLHRVYGLEPKSMGAILGVMTLAGTSGFLIAGFASDRLYGRGRKDAHFLPILMVTPLILLLGIVSYGFHLPLSLVVGLLILLHILQTMANPVAAHFQISSPPKLRGRVAAVKIALQHMVGISVGPALVGAITNFGFKDPSKVGYSMVIATLIIGPFGWLCYWLGRAPARAAATREEARQAAEREMAVQLPA